MRMAAAAEDLVPSHEALVSRARDLAPAIAARADETERMRQIHPDTVADIERAGLWRVLQPGRYGGYEGRYEILIDIGEELGRACTSTAWVWVNLVSHNWMMGMWPVEGQETVWRANPGARIGSATIYPPGKVVPVEGGYRLSGRWPFSSGIDASDWVMLGGMVPPGGPDAKPVPRVFVLPAAAVEVIDSWDVMGLVGTGSKDVACADVFVPASMTLSPHEMRGAATPGMAVNPNPLYRLPLLALFPHIIGGALLGGARGAYDSYVEEMRMRVATFNAGRIADHAAVQIRIAESDSMIRAARALLRDGPREGHRIAASGRAPSEREKTRWRADAAYACRLCRDAVDVLHDASGGGGNYRANRLQRFFRDVHAGCGHIGVSWDANGAEHGRSVLGLPVGNFLL